MKMTCAYCCEVLTLSEIFNNEQKGRDEHSNMYCDACESETKEL